MTNTQLRTFLTVCESMSFTQAARQQYISQPAVSRQMAALEAEIGTPLFERSHSSLQLTAAGQHLARNLKPIVDHLDGLINQVREISAGQSGSLIIGLMLDQAIDQYIIRALRRFRQSHNISINILRYSIMELRNVLKNGNIDLAICVESAPNMFPGCNQYIYASESMCFAARKDLIILDGDRLTERDIQRFAAQYPLLGPRLDNFPAEMRPDLVAPTRNTHLFNTEVEYDLASIAPMVSAGLGGTIINESHMLTRDQDIAIFSFDALPRINKGIFWMPDTLNPLVPQFCQLIQELDFTSLLPAEL